MKSSNMCRCDDFAFNKMPVWTFPLHCVEGKIQQLLPVQGVWHGSFLKVEITSKSAYPSNIPNLVPELEQQQRKWYAWQNYMLKLEVIA